MKKIACAALLFPLLLALGGCFGGYYYPPRTAVNTVGIVKVPLAECPTAGDYEVVYSFEKETNNEWWKKMERGGRIFRRSTGYLIETEFLGKPYYVYESDDGRMQITSALDLRETVAKFRPPKAILGIAAFQQRLKGKDFLVVYVRQKASTHSSTLLIFDDKFQIVYQDHLLGALEIGHTDDKIVVKSDDYAFPMGQINGDWVYFIP